MSRSDQKQPADKNDETDEVETPSPDTTAEPTETPPPNPPRTTTDGWFTVPKFGSAGSGGAEIEPGPERN